MPRQIKLRRGTAADAIAADPVLDQGEPGYEVDTGVVKIGDGTTVWSELPVALTVGADNAVLQDLYTEQRTEPYKMADHTIQAMEKGTFTPLAEEAIVEVGYSGLVAGIGHITSFLLWNQNVAPGTDLMTGQGFEFDPFVADTEHMTVGPASGPGNTGQTRRKVKLTGLTPGEPVTWELVVGATGYYEEFALNVPVDLAMSYNQGNWKLFVTVYSDDKVMVYDPGNRIENGGITREIAEFTGHDGAFGVAIHPTDFGRVYIGRFDADEVVECDTETGDVLRTFSVPTPQCMVVSTDGSKLFVANEASAITPVTLSSGTVGTPITVGTNGGTMKPRALGSHIYVPCPGAHRIDRIAVSNHAVSSLPMGGNTTPAAISINPADSDRIWVLERTPARAREIDVSSFTFTGENTVTGMNGTPNDFGLSPSGRSLVQVSHTRLLQTFVIPGKGTFYESGNGAGSRIHIDTYGDLWILEQGENMFKHFHCGILEIDPNNEFWGGYSDVMVQPATD